MLSSAETAVVATTAELRRRWKGRYNQRQRTSREQKKTNISQNLTFADIAFFDILFSIILLFLESGKQPLREYVVSGVTTGVGAGARSPVIS